MNATGTPATDRQLSFLASLAKERGVTVDTDGMTTRAASAKITELKAQPAARAAAVFNSEPAEEVGLGMYRLEGRIYRVVASRESGNLYAKELVEGSFLYAPGAMRFLRPELRMTLEEAQEYGRRTGSCCVCARRLTNPESIALGIGPVCGGRV